MESQAAGSGPSPGKGDRYYAELWREWRPRARAYARAFGGLTAEDREDIADEAVARAWASRDRFEAGRRFAPWFLTIVRRLALDTSRRRREMAAEPATFDRREAPAGQVDPAPEREAEAAFVRSFVEGLPERERELASLVYGQDLGPAEAARIVGIPAGTAKWRLHEIRKALKKAWEREYGSR